VSTVKNNTLLPLDVDGRMLKPGVPVDVDLEQPGVKAYLESGALIDLSPPVEPPEPTQREVIALVREATVEQLDVLAQSEQARETPRPKVLEAITARAADLNPSPQE